MPSVGGSGGELAELGRDVLERGEEVLQDAVTRKGHQKACGNRVDHFDFAGLVSLKSDRSDR